MGEGCGAAAAGMVGGGDCVQLDPDCASASNDCASGDHRGDLCGSGGLCHVDGVSDCDVARFPHTIPCGD